MKWSLASGLVSLLVTTVTAWPYDEAYLDYNINENKTATNPADYWGTWPGHEGKYFPSPDNWRFPFYSMFLDRFVNGDPTNDNANGTTFEHDIEHRIRHGGDVAGLVDTLDYLQGMGIKGIYITGTSLLNQPWTSDGYGVVDTTLLDAHYGTIQTWRDAITEIHKRGMYVLFDNTIATMADLIGFEGHLNSSTPFSEKEWPALWKSERRYRDFDIGVGDYNASCDYPRFWYEDGLPVNESQTAGLVGCYDSDFDQYGDIEAFGVWPDWKRQLAKFASVQDRLREWNPSVRERLIRHSCMIIHSLDIDGFRYDKGTQATVDALGDMSAAYRECARQVGKENFFITGEITGGNDFGAIYLGRGRQSNQWPSSSVETMKLTNESSAQFFLREAGREAIDSAAFHYTTYRALTRFLGMDGQLAAGFDAPVDWVEGWDYMLRSNDLINANTGKFDPRHMFGATNQDVFRWPAIANGTHRQLLGSFVTTLMLPGIPLLLWGEEQNFYILDANAENYIYGRQAMSPATAWMTHGCFHLDSSQYYQWPIQSARKGCEDVTVAYDHRDPSHPVRNVMKHMFQMRENYPVLNDGYSLGNLTKKTDWIRYPGSNETATETGMWSVYRDVNTQVQDLGSNANNQPVWLLYTNLNDTFTYKFDCKSTNPNETLTAPFDAGTTVKNLFYPYDEIKLVDGARKLGLNGSKELNGCAESMEMKAYEFRAYVPVSKHKSARPMITKFTPGHDFPLRSTVKPDRPEDVTIELYFSEEMSCDLVTDAITLNSSTEKGKVPTIDPKTVNCTTIPPLIQTNWTAEIPSLWKWTANLTGVYNGVHKLTVNNATNTDKSDSTNAIDHFLFRVGQIDNPMVFTTANYSSSLLHKKENGDLFIQHHAAGADKYRYSTNWGSSFSDWKEYKGGNDTIDKLPWSGTKRQEWDGEHVRVEYWSRLTGSSDYVQQGDAEWDHPVTRRFPHAFFNGPYNQYGYDAGLDNEIRLDTKTGVWSYHFTSEWPAVGQLNIWGINPDGKPDQTWVLGDTDNDTILDRSPPSALSATVINITLAPAKGYLSHKLYFDDGTLRFWLDPVGPQSTQIVMFILFWIIPFITAVGCVYIFMKSFYKVKFNEVGVSEKQNIPLAIWNKIKPSHSRKDPSSNPLMRLANKSGFMQSASALGGALASGKRRMVLIATMEYDIEDWAIKIKIGGLGVMAQLMGKTLGHQDLIWVVPCVGGVDYPVDQVAEPMTVTILGSPYQVQVQYHVLNNITYVLLDAPVFRQQSKTEPYPARMDDLDSAVYYSAWNQCVAEAIKRFPIDTYHINDYHGSLAPLYLLPRTIPACLSLHNAEFQGLWPMRTVKEKQEVCSVFNLEEDVARRYVQFGEVFNLLHAGASYLRVHQAGFGAVGVSKKYGKRSYARYPIFWGLHKVGNLPNPDPSDVGEWSKEPTKDQDITVDPTYEAGRGELKRQAQEWAGLDQNPDADLLVFVGRWSMQKGVDLIADAMPAVIEARPNVQLICIGPVIDLYGKFAALKLDHMMKVYPGRVFSKPEFTALPPFIFSGAEFALIPSRDEPFGLVAVEFGRKGALGIGARVGGLGQMPGWWYNVESVSTSHLLMQFKLAIEAALNSKTSVRAMMRARSAKQRFPVAQWVEDLEILQTTAIQVHNKEASKTHSTNSTRPGTSSGYSTSGAMSPSMTQLGSPLPSPGMNSPFTHSRESSYSFNQMNNLTTQKKVSYSADPDQDETEKPKSGLSRSLSLGVRSGPGHAGRRRRAGDSGIPESDENGATDVEGDDNSDEEAAHNAFDDDEYTLTPAQVEAGRRAQAAQRDRAQNFPSPSRRASQESLHPRFMVPLESPRSPGTPPAADSLLLPPQPFAESNRLSSASVLSLDSVVGNKTDFKLQKVDPFFTDSTGEYFRIFDKKLDVLNGSNSESQLCIEEFLIKSEQQWFDRFRNARLGRNKSPTPSIRHSSRNTDTPDTMFYNDDLASNVNSDEDNHLQDDEFLLGKDYVPPTGLKKWMQIKIGDWPVYSMFLALGQIIAANSYQITLLTGEVGQTAEKLYGIATTYAIASMCWWLVYRYFKSVVCLSTPWFLYGFAFLLIGSAHWEGDSFTRGWIQNVGTGFYAAASASGSIFFASNFGDEGGAPVKTWIFRACVIQGIQQAYVIALWYWGSTMTKASSQGLLNPETNIANSWKMSAICYPICVFLCLVGVLLAMGLPNYYRQKPGKVPSFYKSLFRRKIVSWNFVAVILQNFFLSAPYGRNWSFLWGSIHTHAWQIVLLCVVFFGFVWCIFLFVVSKFSKRHSWFLPVFACGLGAPRFIQIWWAISGIGYYLPWAGGYTSGALVSRSLWLWLGVLDSIQGLGFGIILLQTLTRVHMCFALIASQVIGSIATICARAFGPNSVGPGPISPDMTQGAHALANAWFWVALFCQLLICAGFLLFFRKEQLAKP